MIEQYKNWWLFSMAIVFHGMNTQLNASYRIEDKRQLYQDEYSMSLPWSQGRLSQNKSKMKMLSN